VGNAITASLLGVGFPQQVAVPALTEVTIGQAVIPANLAAGAAWQLHAWAQLVVGATAGNITVRLRLGSLAGTVLAAASTGNFTANATGGVIIDAHAQVITPGGPAAGSVSGDLQVLALAGVTGNAPVVGPPVLNDMTQPTPVLLTLACLSATFTATGNGGYALRVA
jgi:hypothetical protein